MTRDESPAWLLVAIGLFVLLVSAAAVVPSTLAPENRMGEAAGLTLAGAADAAQGPSTVGAPLPTQDPGEIDSAIIGGKATWYCGGGSPCTRGHGPGELIAAIDPSLGIRKGTHLRVHHEGRSVDVTVVDVCACAGTRIIDLSRLAFSKLADPSQGVIDVAIEEVRGVSVAGFPTPPATDR